MGRETPTAVETTGTNGNETAEGLLQALAVYEQTGRARAQARVLLEIGAMEATLRRMGEAREGYGKALALYEEMNDIPRQSETLERLSQLVASEDPQLARQYTKWAAALRAQAKAEEAGAEKVN